MQYIKKNVISETLHTKYHRTTPDEWCAAAKPTEYRVRQKWGQNYHIISGLGGMCPPWIRPCSHSACN